MLLPVSACRDVEFTCDNDVCLPRYSVCNGIDDCGDNSDEIRGCSKAFLKLLYSDVCIIIKLKSQCSVIKIQGSSEKSNSKCNCFG
jgi:hypothetical protein